MSVFSFLHFLDWRSIKPDNGLTLNFQQRTSRDCFELIFCQFFHELKLLRLSNYVTKHLVYQSLSFWLKSRAGTFTNTAGLTGFYSNFRASSTSLKFVFCQFFHGLRLFRLSNHVTKHLVYQSLGFWLKSGAYIFIRRLAQLGFILISGPPVQALSSFFVSFFIFIFFGLKIY